LRPVAVEGDVIGLVAKAVSVPTAFLNGGEALRLGETSVPLPERIVAAGVEKDQVTRCSASILASTCAMLTEAVFTLALRPSRRSPGSMRRAIGMSQLSPSTWMPCPA